MKWAIYLPAIIGCTAASLGSFFYSNNPSAAIGWIIAAIAWAHAADLSGRIK